MSIFLGLSSHLLDLNWVGLASSHVQLVVALKNDEGDRKALGSYHAKSKNSLVYPQSLDPKGKVGRLLVNWLDHKLPVRERNVSDFAPWKTNFRR